MPLPTTLISSLNQGAGAIAVEAPLAAHAYVLVETVRATSKPVVHVLPQDKDMAAAAALCEFLAPELEVLQLPAWDTLPYDRVSPSNSITAARLSCLGRLAVPSSKPYILLTTVNAVTQKLPPREQFAKARFAIKKGNALKRNDLFTFLAANGYQRVGKVMEAGEYAVRGSLIDLFPSGYEAAIRIDMFGDEVESLKSFDPLTQISDAPVESLELRAVSEVLLQPETISRFRARYLEMFGAITKDDPLYESISEGRTYQCMEHWLPLFYDHLDSLAEYCEGAVFSADHRLQALVEERHEAISDYYGARKLHQRKDGANYNPVPPEQLFLNHDGLLHSWRTHARISVTPFAFEGAVSLGLRLSPQLFNKRHEEGLHARDVILDYIRGAELPVMLAANSVGSADRIRKMLDLKDDMPAELVILPIEQGFTSPEFILLTEQDMFGERIIRTQKRKRKSEAFLAEAASFIEGELIVHREHGIGRFEGLITVEVNDTRHDCLKLTYDGGTLFLPVENIDLVSRYGTAEGPVALDKLGGVAWQKRKSALKKRLKMAAEALIKVAAERASIAAPSFSADAGLYDEFVDRFPYTETDDQLQAIDEVRADLSAGHAMDRLVCGDVGFGKTEVALRAAFIAASNGQQVAVIAPTTLLARQHFHTFSERFRDLPFKVRMLSRLTSAADAVETKALLPEGKIDIVIGTHALLAAG
ncbi:MAG: CarD family transcriptional regulator, partial [Rickettsiales bacterium]